MEEPKQPQSKSDTLKRFLSERFRMHVNSAGSVFNGLEQKTKRMILLASGIMAFVYALVLMIAPFIVNADKVIMIDRITQPIDIYEESPMKQQSQQLIPLGKMKGEVDGKFEAFYIALDQEGQIYINRDPPYGEDRFIKSNGWETVSNEQFREYEKQLHFIPHAQKGLKP